MRMPPPLKSNMAVSSFNEWMFLNGKITELNGDFPWFSSKPCLMTLEGISHYNIPITSRFHIPWNLFFWQVKSVKSRCFTIWVFLKSWGIPTQTIVVSVLSHGYPCSLDDLKGLPFDNLTYLLKNIGHGPFSSLIYQLNMVILSIPIPEGTFRKISLPPTRQETAGNLWHATEVHRGMDLFFGKLIGNCSWKPTKISGFHIFHGVF